MGSIIASQVLGSLSFLCISRNGEFSGIFGIETLTLIDRSFHLFIWERFFLGGGGEGEEPWKLCVFRGVMSCLFCFSS